MLKVYVKNNDEVQKGQPLFDIDPTSVPHRRCSAAARTIESVRRSVNGANVDGGGGQGRGCRRPWPPSVYARQDAARLEQIYEEDPGAISLRRVQNAQATRLKARSQVKAAEADLRSAQEAAGESGERNAQLISARSAVEKAELDLKRTGVIAPAGGLVTDLRTDVGQFLQAGRAAMTLIADARPLDHADMTENNLGNIDPGDEAAIVLDVLPGKILKGACAASAAGSVPGSRRSRERCPRSRTAAIGCARRSASRWPSRSTRPSARICAGCASADRPTCWSTRATMA